MLTNVVTQNAIRSASIVVDKLTGEVVRDEMGILTVAYDRYYETVKSAVVAKDTVPSFNPKIYNSVKAMNQIFSYMDKRTLVERNNIKGYFNSMAGYAMLNKVKPSMNHKQYKLLNIIADNLTYRNFVIGKTNDIATLLNVKRCNLRRTLKIISEYVYIDDYTKHGEMRIWITPAFAFKYTSDYFELARYEAINNWYSFSLNHRANIDNDFPNVPDYSYKGKDSYVDVLNPTVEDGMDYLYVTGEAYQGVKPKGYYTMNDSAYEKEFGKKRNEAWPDMPNDSHNFLPEHLTIAGQSKQYHPAKLNWA